MSYSHQQQAPPPALEACVHHVFRGRVAETPEAPAVAAHDENFSYRELDDYSERLAKYLRSLQLEAGSIIALCFEKSGWAIVAMLGVLKAGHACANLSPTYPAERNKSILSMTHSPIILTNVASQIRDKVSNCTIIEVSREQVTALSVAPGPMSDTSTPQDIAYVLFTSGSTGEPKGIVVEHGSLCTSAMAHGSKWGIESGTRVFQFSSYTFDVSVADMFFSLMRGACVCSPSEIERLEDLSGAVSRLKANWAFLTPSVAATVKPTTVPTLRTLLLGGEAATQQSIDDWAENVDLIICTGPAECSIYCMGSSPCTRLSDPANVGFPIGGRLWVANTEDPMLLVTPGEIGELLIEGRIVSRGYLQNEVATQKAYLYEPPWLPKEEVASPRKVYRTGDLVRQNPDGSYNFIGRRDDQVKIRGQRVELQEIETGIRRASLLVSRVKALYRRDSGQQAKSTLAAFIQFKSQCEGVDKELDAIKAYMVPHLPSYMIPDHYVVLDSMPLTLNGKTDITSLQQILDKHQDDISENQRSSATIAENLLSKEEAILRALWASILGIEKGTIGQSSSFIELGGNSLDAMQLVSAARAEHFALSFRSVMESPRLGDMAAACKTHVPATSTLQADTMVGEYDLVAEAAQLMSLPNEAIEACYPCYTTQEAMFLSSMATPGVYILQNVYHLSQEVDKRRFQEACEMVVRQYPILRTRIFLSEKNQWQQAVIREPQVWDEPNDLEEYLNSVRCGLAQTGKPLLHLAWCPDSSSEGQHTFVLTWHHALYDGPTFDKFMSSVTEFYFEGTVPQESVTMKSFVQYERSLRMKHIGQSSEAEVDVYAIWPKAPSIPSNPRSARGMIQLPDRADWGIARSYTLPTALQSAFGILLAAYTGSTKVKYAVTLSGRDAPLDNIGALVGPTLATVPFYAHSENDELVANMLQETKLSVWEKSSSMYSEPDRALETPTTLLVIQPESRVPARLVPGLEAPVRQLEDMPYVPFLVECMQLGNTVEVLVHYDDKVLPESLIHRFIEQLGNVTTQILCAEADMTAGNIELTTDTERVLINNWNTFGTMRQHSRCMHDVIFGVADLNPSAEAICSSTTSFTYGELRRVSVLLGTYLRSIGVEGGVVPISADKSPLVVIAMLAVLHAGAAFVLLDEDLPDDRLRQSIRRVHSKAIIVSEKSETLFEGMGQITIRLESVLELASSITEPPPEHSTEKIDSSSLAYIIFTSGTTGEPKGILVNHDNFVTGALARSDQIDRTNRSRVYQFSSYTFDTCIEDIITTLMVGGCVCVPSSWERSNDLAGSFQRLNANTIDMTPSTSMLLTPDRFPTLKTLILGGEAMTASHIRKWAASVNLINTYGPSEASCVTTIHRCNIDQSDPAIIGKAWCGQTWITDPNNHRRLLPLGAIGELVIGGPIVSEGYHQLPEETRNSFVSDEKGDRFFKTGDLVFYNEDGLISYVGRKDNQVKIRGQRVEPSEIETVIQGHEKVTAVSVAYLSLASKDMVLVAFVQLSPVPIATGKPDSIVLEMSAERRLIFNEIEKQCMKVLPTYMIPEVFVPITELPFSISGKLNRRVLHEAILKISSVEVLDYRLAIKESFRPPVTSMQFALRRIWAQSLSFPEESIGLGSHFFKLGGNSLAAVTLVALAQNAGFALSTANVFQSPRLEEMAESLSHLRQTVQSISPFALANISVDEARRYLQSQLSTLEIENVYPCTSGQVAFMLSTAKQPQAYVAQHIYRLRKDICPKRWEAAWQTVIRENAILRTAIIFTDKAEHYQVVLKYTHLFNHGSSMKKYLQDDKKSNMGYGSLLTRFALVHDQDEVFFIHTAHHATFDDHTLTLLARRAINLYESKAFSPQTDEKAADFSRFVGAIQSIDSKNQEAYWREELSGAEPTAYPPSSSYSNGVREEKIVECSFETPKDIHSTAFTTATLIRAAWALVLGHYGESEDVLFASVLSGRNADIPAITSIVGPTVTTVPVRIRIPPNVVIDEFLATIQRQSTAMIPYEQDGLIQIERFMPGSTKTNSVLVLHQKSESDELSHMVEVNVSSYGEGIAQQSSYHAFGFIIDCFLDDENGSIRACFDEKTMTAQQVHSLLRCFAFVIQQLSSNISNGFNLSKIEFCSPEDKALIMSQNTNVTARQESCIHDLVREIVLAKPDGVAVDAWDGSLTYEELDRKSNCLASYLNEHFELTPGLRIVPVCFDKSVFTVVTMLAILKAGAAYVPLDPTYPPARLQAIVEQVHAGLVFTDQLHRSIFSSVKSVVVDEEFLKRCAASRSSDSPLSSASVSPDDPSMILFTSGSTGQPKGVVLTHSGFCTLALGLSPKLGLGPDSRVLQFAAHAFDVSNSEIFMTLIQGGCVCVAGEEERFNDLAGVIASFQVNFLYLTPTATAALNGPQSAPSIKTLLLGGEAARQDIVDEWARHVSLILTYGPCETTIWPSISYLYPNTSPLNIGRGDSCNMWLVDRNDYNKLVSPGAVGEILIEGPLLAQGYFEDEAKTNAAFIWDPRWSQSNSLSSPRRFYRTGDTARLNDDGSLTFCGRIGAMIKLRGMRVDLGDVESHVKRLLPSNFNVCAELLRSPRGQDAIVAFMAPTDGQQKESLIKITLDATQNRLLGEIEKGLTESLPRYMMPSLLVFMTKIPKTPSGKTDRKTLRALYTDTDLTRLWTRMKPVEEEDSAEIPISSNETVLRKLWAQVLGLPAFDIHRNCLFFQIGGDSISAMQLSRHARALSIDLSVSDIFAAPRLVGMAKMMRPLSGEDTQIAPFSLIPSSMDVHQRLQAASPLEIEDTYPCSPLQSGLMLLSAEQAGAYIADYAFHVPSSWDIQQFKQSWQATVDAFDILRSRIFYDEEIGFVQLVYKDRTISWCDYPSVHSKEQTWEGHDLSEFYMCKMDPTHDSGFMFTLRLHHAIFDGQTLDLMMEHARAVFDGLERPFVVPFNHFIHFLQTQDKDKIARFWLSHLQDFKGNNFPLSQSTMKSENRAVLKRDCQVPAQKAMAASFATRLQLAWAIVLSLITHSTDVVYGLTLSGRDTPISGIERITGPTLVTLPFRARLALDEKVEDGLSSTAKLTAETMRFQHIGLPAIRKICSQSVSSSPNNRLIIEHVDNQGPSPWLESADSGDTSTSYHTDSFMLHCAYSASKDCGNFTVQLTADFDSTAVSSDVVAKVRLNMEQVLIQLESTATQLGDLTFTSRIRETFNLSACAIQPPSVVVNTNVTQPPVALLPHERSVLSQFLSDLRAMIVKVLHLPEEEFQSSLSWIQLGGDSISAMRLAALLRSTGVPMTVTRIMTCGPVSELAQVSRSSMEGQRAQLSLPSDSKKRLLEFKEQMKGATSQELESFRFDEIEDIAPTSGFQAQMLRMSTLPDRGWENHMTIALEAPVADSRVKHALQELIDKIPILRTQFVEWKGDIISVVLRTLIVHLEELRDCEDLNEGARQWAHNNLALEGAFSPLRLNSAILTDRQGRSSLVFYLPHYRYDGVSLPRIFEDFNFAYRGGSIEPRPSFVSYAIAARQMDASSEGQAYWRSLLSGASMTSITASKHSESSNPTSSSVYRTVQQPNLIEIGITFASLLRASWAAVLSQWCRIPDVVFGQLVSGRAIGIDEVEEIVGPCLNVIPVRLQVDPEQPIQHLLQDAHHQALRSSQWESMGFENIVKQCTDWPPHSRFTSVIQHQNIEDTDSLITDAKASRVGLICPDFDFTELWITTCPQKDSMIRISIDYSPNLFSADTVTLLLDILVDVMAQCAQAPLQPLHLHSRLGDLPDLPL